MIESLKVGDPVYYVPPYSGEAPVNLVAKKGGRKYLHIGYPDRDWGDRQFDLATGHEVGGLTGSIWPSKEAYEASLAQRKQARGLREAIAPSLERATFEQLQAIAQLLEKEEVQ